MPKARSEVSGEADESARDQFAALGLFIQRFERIVSLLRDDCRWILMGGNLGVSITRPSVMVTHWKVCSLPFHHEAMTAGPLVQIWRALVFEHSEALVSLSKLTNGGKAVVVGITAEIEKRFSDVIATRNTIVHATWQIGFWHPDEHDFSTVMVEKI
jgi:hypothetical protein